MKRLTSCAVALVMTAALVCCRPGENGPGTGGTRRGENTATEETTLIPHFETEYTARIDFSKTDCTRTPYLKKFDMFSATWSWCNDFSSDPKLTQKNIDKIPDIALLLPESVRTDLFMGYYGIGRNIGKNGRNGTTDEEFRLVKQLTDSLGKSSLRAEFMYFASPEYTGGGADGDAWKRVDDLEKWENLCFNIAGYFKKNDMNVIRHEIWNEPDYIDNGTGVFYSGTWQDYINLYLSGARGIRRADPDALVGGVSAAWIHELYKNGGYSEFLRQTYEAGELPDYVSWHFYGSNGGMRMLEKYIDAARAGLEESNDYSTVQQCLNEFNVSLDRNIIKSYRMVALTLDAYEQLLAATDITRVNWTSALDRENDDSAALIDPKTGERRPAYYTQWMYARLPVRCVTAECGTNRVGIMAARGTDRCGAIIYDRFMEDTGLTLNFAGLPFDDCTMTVYVIDSENPQGRVTSDVPLCTGKYVCGGDTDYSVRIPANGAVYVEFSRTGTETDTHERVSGLSGNVVRTDYWYNGRDDNGAYAWFGSNSLMSFVGSGSSEKSDGAAVAATMDDMTGKTLLLETAVFGDLSNAGKSAMLGVTVDYSVGGEYVSKTYFTLTGAGTETAVPLGTKRMPDTTVELSAGAFSLNLDGFAPENWDGRILLTFVCNGMRKGVCAEFTVNNGQSE